MKSIIKTLLRRRWYIFVLVGVVSLAMNTVFWNETTRFIRSIPYLNQLKSYAKSNYELLELSPTADFGKHPEELVQVLTDTFVDNPKVTVYENRTSPMDYLVSHVTTDDLHVVTVDDLQQHLIKESSIHYLSTLLIVGSTERLTADFEQNMQSLGYPIRLKPVKDVYEIQAAYFRNNLIFAVGAVSLAVGLTLLFNHFILSAAIRICKADIRTLRVIGAPCQSLIDGFTLLCLSPIVLGLVLFLILSFTVFSSLIVADYVVLSLLNLMVILLVWGQVRRRLKEVLYA